jgi:hypothetical protein
MLRLVDNLLIVNNFYLLINVFFDAMVQGLLYDEQNHIIMRDQIIEVNGQCPSFGALHERVQKPALSSYPDGAFWLKIYPPLSDLRAPLPNSRILCPWSMAAELEDSTTPTARRTNIMNALNRGLKTIRQYNLPACRIMFAEDRVSREISVWVE